MTVHADAPFIVFHHMATPVWRAGAVVQELLFAALRTHAEAVRTNLRLGLSVWDNADRGNWAEQESRCDSIMRFPAGGDAKSIRTRLEREGVSAFFSLPFEAGTTLEFPRILWIYDFQHLHFPQFFSEAEIERRRRIFPGNAAHATRILAYSEAVKSDILNFMPETAGRVHVIRFVPHIPRAVLTQDHTRTLSGYHLPGRFFYIPNQIMPHKNHAVAIEALSILKSRGIEATVVCTGSTPAGNEDLRQTLLAGAREKGVANQFIVLDVVPRQVVYSLYSRCAAVINPSRFEGFGLSAPEATAFGKPVVLSDLPVLREHGTGDSRYFDPLDAESLASHMEDILRNSPISPDHRTLERAFERHEKTFRRFGHDLFALFTECADVVR